jgi:hypothetical protein
VRAPVTTTQFLLALISIFIAAKLFGEIAERIGQPAVLGEMVRRDRDRCIRFSPHRSTQPAVGNASITGVLLPFAGGYAIGALLRFPLPYPSFSVRR